MEYSVKVTIGIFIIWAFRLHVNCEEFDTEEYDGITTEYPKREQLKCLYSLVNAEYICDCHNREGPFVLEKLTGDLNALIVRNCEDLSVLDGTFRDVGYLGTIHFKNIDGLSFGNYSLAFRPRLPAPNIKVTFEHVNFHQLDSHSIGGYIDSVIFIDCHINKFNAYALSSLYQSVFNISFVNTVIDTIERQALRKLQIDHLMILNTTFTNYLPSQTFSALTISKEFSILNSSFSTINTQAFDLDDVNDFVFSGNEIGRLAAEAFKINVAGRVFFERNNFTEISHSALIGFQCSERIQQSRKEIHFISNYINSTDNPIQFEVDRKFYLRIHNLKFSRTIDCDQAEALRQSNFLLPYAETVYFRFGEENDKNPEFNSITNILSNKCAVTSYIIAIASTVAVVVLITIIAIVAIFYRFLQKHQPPPRQVNMVIPDGKTYRETQIIMEIENAGLLKTNL